jgi:hypothetical protein
MPTRTLAWDIDSMIIAALNSSDVPQTPVTVRGAVSMQAEVRVKSGEQPGDGGIYGVASKPVAVTMTIQFADLQAFEPIEVMTGIAPESSGSPQALTQVVNSKPYPFFYMAGKTFLDDGIGSLHILVLKAKITGNFSIGLADGAFVVPQFTATAVLSQYIQRGGRNTLMLPVRYPSDVALAIPPTSVPLVVA